MSLLTRAVFFHVAMPGYQGQCDQAQRELEPQFAPIGCRDFTSAGAGPCGGFAVTDPQPLLARTRRAIAKLRAGRERPSFNTYHAQESIRSCPCPGRPARHPPKHSCMPIRKLSLMVPPGTRRSRITKKPSCPISATRPTGTDLQGTAAMCSSLRHRCTTVQGKAGTPGKSGPHTACLYSIAACRAADIAPGSSSTHETGLGRSELQNDVALAHLSMTVGYGLLSFFGKPL